MKKSFYASLSEAQALGITLCLNTKSITTKSRVYPEALEEMSNKIGNHKNTESSLV